MIKGPLDGIRVVEITLFQQGPVAGKRVGDLWAEVIKVETLKKEGCIFTPVQTPLEVTRAPRAWANNYFFQVDHPEWGPLTMPGFPWDFSETPASWRLPAPGLGDHTEEILAGLGFGKKEISKCLSEQIVYSEQG